MMTVVKNWTPRAMLKAEPIARLRIPVHLFFTGYSGLINRYFPFGMMISNRAPFP
jgi:hypothetical protein